MSSLVDRLEEVVKLMHDAHVGGRLELVLHGGTPDDMAVTDEYVRVEARRIRSMVVALERVAHEYEVFGVDPIAGDTYPIREKYMLRCPLLERYLEAEGVKYEVASNDGPQGEEEGYNGVAYYHVGDWFESDLDVLSGAYFCVLAGTHRVVDFEMFTEGPGLEGVDGYLTLERVPLVVSHLERGSHAARFLKWRLFHGV